MRMGKRGKNQTKGDKNPKRRLRGKGDVVEEVMDDEIDACMLFRFLGFLWYFSVIDTIDKYSNLSLL